MNSCLEIVVGEWHWDRSMTHWQRQLVLCEVMELLFFFFLLSQSADQLSLNVKLIVRQTRIVFKCFPLTFSCAKCQLIVSCYITGQPFNIATTKVNEIKCNV